MTYTGREATPGTVLTVISFALLLIVNLITPIIRQLHFVKISRKSTADELTIGLWGYCAQNSGEAKKCTSPKIGFAFDASKSLNTNLIPDLPGAVSVTLSYLVMVHIVALITLSIVTCVGAYSHTKKNRDKGLIRIAAQSSALAFVFVLFAFIVDFILFNIHIVKPINNVAGSVYSAEFDAAYYLVIVCLISSGLATISFFIGKIMNNRRNKPEEELFDDKVNDIFNSEQQMNEGFREQNQNQNQYIAKYADFEEEVVESGDAVKSSQFSPGSEYITSQSRLPGPPNPPQSHPMRPWDQGRSSRPTSPSGRPFPSPPAGIPQYPPLSSQSSSPTYTAYNSYYPPNPPPNQPPNQPPILPYNTYPNSNIYPSQSEYSEYPPSSHHWGQNNYNY